MLLVRPLVAAALVARVEVGAVLAAEAQAVGLAFGVELGRSRQLHSPSMCGPGAAVNLLCSLLS